MSNDILKILKSHQDALDIISERLDTLEEKERQTERMQHDINFLKEREKKRCNLERDKNHTLH